MNIFFYRQIEACSQALASFCSIFEEAIKMKGKCERGSLFTTGKSDAIDLFNISGSVDQYPFYSRCIGFHVRITKLLFIYFFNKVDLNEFMANVWDAL